VTERRRDPISGQWRTFAAHRQDRTFLPPAEECPLCPTRGGSPATEVPWSEFDVAVFENRFPSFVANPPEPSVPASELYGVEPNLGATEVVVYSDDHRASMGSLGVERLRLLVDVWADRYAELGAREEVAYVFVFENRGESVGVTLHHPHGQIYAYPEIPPTAAQELASARQHMEATGTCVMCDVVAQERAEAVRLLGRNDAFVAYVPFAARFPYEVHVTAHRHVPSLLDLSDPERNALAAMLSEVVVRYDGLFGFELPYVMSMHQAPTDEGEWQSISHLHIEFTPFHRSAQRLKYLAGSELGAGAFLNDVVPEQAAASLRGVSVST
jgi:UDPglucose--hexose-1-phosphate uridylyltransferase